MGERGREHAADLELARKETRAAFENRAIIYAYILEELEAEVGIERATELMKRAIYKRGLEIGQRYRDAVRAGDLTSVGRTFVTSSPSEGALFEPFVDQAPLCGRTVLAMSACPLVDAWREAGYDDERVDLLCEIAAAVDFGTFEGAGLELAFLDRRGCRGSERCLLELRLKEEL